MATQNSPVGVSSDISTTALNLSLSEYSGRITDNVYNKHVLLNWLNTQKKTVDGGVSIIEHLIETKQDNGGFYEGADTLNNTQSHTTTQVEYKWQNAYEPIVISRDEERINSGSAHKILDLAGTKMTLSEKALADRLEQALSTPVGSAGNLIDLETLVNTGALGSISGATDTFWQSTVTASGSFASQGLSDMTTAYYAVSSSSGSENPNFLITTSSVFQDFEKTRLPLERISNVSSANAGFENLTFKGKTLVYGEFIGTGLLFELNSNYVSLAVDSMTDMVTTPFIEPSNQTLKVAYILWRGNLVTNNRRRLAKLTGIT